MLFNANLSLVSLPAGDGHSYTSNAALKESEGASPPTIPEAFIKQYVEDPLTGPSHRKSIVFSPMGHELRVKIRTFTHNDKIHADEPIWVTKDSPAYAWGFREGAKRSCSHWAALQGDVLFLAELIYSGAVPNKRDAAGMTPIMLAALAQARIRYPDYLPQYTIPPPPRPGDPTAHENVEYAARLGQVIRLLVNQHIDVNQVLGDNLSDLLDLTTRARDWESIGVLFDHGCCGLTCLRAYQNFLHTRLDTAAERSKFDSVFRVMSNKAKEEWAIYQEKKKLKAAEDNKAVQSVPESQSPSSASSSSSSNSSQSQAVEPAPKKKAWYSYACGYKESTDSALAILQRMIDAFDDGPYPEEPVPFSPHSRARPARQCPCFSGKAARDCHMRATTQYPIEHICCCGSGKKYKNCCDKKGIGIFERFLPEPIDRIVAFYGAHNVEFGRRVAWFTEHAVYKALMHPRDGSEDNRRAVGKALDEVGKKYGRIDLAFKYACMRAQPPIPTCRKTGIRTYATDHKTRWNSLVDEYINSPKRLQYDKRSALEIERQAKVGTWCGRYLRQCENDFCTKAEDREEQFKLCKHCQTAVYCGVNCQRSAWLSHRKQCSSRDLIPQYLPSQQSIRLFLMHEMGEDLFRGQGRKH